VSLTFPAPGRPGPTNTLVDVAGLRVGHAQRTGDGWLSGTTVVLAPPGGAVAGVDVRGGGPGTRETDLLDPRNGVERVHGVVLSGGSAYGLASATGVVRRMAADGVGLLVGPARDILVPILPGAVVFDLGRGGDASLHPGEELGAAAYDDAHGGPVRQGSVGAGTGTVVGTLRGGIGSASAVLDDGTTVAALAVVNAVGAPFDPRTGELLGAALGFPGEFDLGRPDADDVARVVAAAEAGPTGPLLHTTLGVVATDVALTKAQAGKLAALAHDGMARAIRPVHSMFDGDTVFGLATGDRPPPDPLAFHAVLASCADVFARAVAHGVLAATTVQTPAGRWLSYRDAFPSAFAGARA
jgi:putative pantetheine hydrolase